MTSTPADVRGMSLKARLVVPAVGPQIEGGVVEIDHDGRLVSVRSETDEPTVDLGDVAILPGLVNAHTHLEFSTLERPLSPGPPFTEWVRRLVAWRRGRGDRRGILEAGIEELRASATAAAAEIVTAPAGPDDYVATAASVPGSPTTVLFQEVIASRPEQADIALVTAGAHMAACVELGVPPGLSPHAPFSVALPVFEKLAASAARSRVPLAVHLAETVEERRFLERGDGPIERMLADFGALPSDRAGGGLSFADYMACWRDVERVCLIHGNVLDDAEAAAVARTDNVTVVYCPRTHAFFGHSRHPWRDILRAGGRVAFGTDGRGSNPDLAVWREAKFVAAREPDEDRAALAARLVHCVTAAGAWAIGLERVTGSIVPGLMADLTLFDLSGVDGTEDPLAEILDRGLDPLAAYRSGTLSFQRKDATMPA